MIGNQIDDTLTGLDFSALYRIADYHEKQATIIRARACTLQDRAQSESEVAHRIQFYKDSYKIVARHLRRGYALEDAIRLTAEHTGMDQNTVRNWWNKFKRS